MRKVISVRLREDIVKEIDSKCKEMGLNRTEFIKKALEFYIDNKNDGKKAN
ncbi:ribbon-helix-helix domain-containing protein [Acidianus sp. RZ1]|uniref:ribbon-helix-helix domain-containing protein n=1 Tax=Acidianus sp. RZ1 TaxID=1540082 RepID=UPI00149119A0|nr:ribbon-helix-helix domain-containing protein [Acidianus sp. RZ1]NON62809.1 CopG family transcriptional regulator [Acidianus sp. RZ1]